MFKSVKIKNLRAITELEFNDFSRVNLLVGQNNCGKTTVLEALFFLIGAPNPYSPVVANSLRGLNISDNKLWRTFFHNMETEDCIEILGKIGEDLKEHRLLIRAMRESSNLVPSSDVISLGAKNGESEFSPVKNGLELEYKNPGDPDSKKSSIYLNKDNNFVTNGSKGTSAIKGGYMGPLTIYGWKEYFDIAQRKKQVPELISLLKKIDPRIADLRLDINGLLEVDIGLPHLLIFNLVGCGTIKLLDVALAMHAFANGVVLIDEIDNGLHHSTQEILWKAVFAWAEKLNVQVFATTHSYECVRAFAKCSKDFLFPGKAKLYRIERKDDKFRTIDFDTQELDRFLEKKWEIR